VSVLKLLIEKSYLGHEMHHMAKGGEMPESVRKMLAEIGPMTGPGSEGHGAPRKAG